MYLPKAVQKQAEIGEVLAEITSQFSPDVVHIRYDIGKDWSGDWPIFFRILLSDAASRGSRLSRVTAEMRRQLAERLKPETLGVLACYSFRSHAEQARLREEAWA